MLSSHKSPSPTASIGRSARYIASSTREASSISSIETAENPRTVPSIPGSPTIRDPFGSTSEISLSPSPSRLIPSIGTMSAAFRTNSPDCRYDGLATSTRLFGRVNARCTAFAAAIVDLPHCRVQFRIPASPPTAALPPASHPARSPAASARIPPHPATAGLPPLSLTQSPGHRPAA